MIEFKKKSFNSTRKFEFQKKQNNNIYFFKKKTMTGKIPYGFVDADDPYLHSKYLHTLQPESKVRQLFEHPHLDRDGTRFKTNCRLTCHNDVDKCRGTKMFAHCLVDRNNCLRQCSHDIESKTQRQVLATGKNLDQYAKAIEMRDAAYAKERSER